jgi:hypothetical protein
MKPRHACVLLCSIALLAGAVPGWCGDATMPRYTDPLAGLYPSPASSLPRDVALRYYEPGGGTGKPGRAVLTMALVPGANYHKVRAYMNEVSKGAGSNAMYLQLQPVMNRTVQILKDRYPWLEVAPDLATAEKRDVSLTLVLDVRSRVGASAGDTSALQIDVVAFDEHRQPLGRFIAEGKAAASGNGNGFPNAARQALDALTATSKKYFN